MKWLVTFTASTWGRFWMLMLVPCALGATAPEANEAPAVRLRFEWTGGDAQVWSGSLSIDEGRLAEPRTLGIDPDESDTFWHDEGGLAFKRRNSQVSDGFDITVIAPAHAVLTFNLSRSPDRQQAVPELADAVDPLDGRAVEPGSGAPGHVEFRVSDLYHKERVVALQQPNAQLVVRRAPGDVLPVTIDRPHLIYSPGERFLATVRLNLFESRERAVTANVQWRLTPARGGRTLDSGTQSIKAATNTARPPSCSLEFPLPQGEGAYDIHVTATGRGFYDAARVIQIVVLGDKPPHRDVDAAAQPDRLVDEFDLAATGLHRRVTPGTLQKLETSMARWRRGATANHLPEHAIRASEVADWSAYRLAISRLDRPHWLVVTLPRGAVETLGVSIIQPNAAGQVVPYGVDSGFAPGGSSKAADQGNLVEHRMLFWPAVRDPVVLLHGAGASKPAVGTKVQVFEIGEHLPNRAGAGDASLSDASEAPRRLVGPYMHKPLLAENFGASEYFDAAGGRGIDDWKTFLVASERLIEYLRFQGHNGMMLAVLADGSSLYPSELLESAPRYDTGLFSSTGQDPLQKDVVELLLQKFDRDNLSFVPELQFSSPLPALQRILADRNAAPGVQLVGHDGRTWQESHQSSCGQAPHYNPLDPRVQSAVLGVVREFVERYQSHRSFRGLSLELSRVGYLQFPGLEWGYDDETIARFEQATGIRVPGAAGKGRYELRYQFLTTKASREWLHWRAQELALFHRQLARAVTRANPRATVYLSGQRLLSGVETTPRPDAALARSKVTGHGPVPDEPTEISQRVIRSGGTPEQLLLPRGLDWSLYASEPRLTVLRPIVEASFEGRVNREVLEALNYSPALDAAYRSASRGSLFYHRPCEVRVSSFDAASPWQPAYTRLAPHISWTGDESRRRYTHALAVLDSQTVFEGGWMIPLGQEDQSRDLRDAIRALPAVRFRPSGPQVQPAIVRTAHADGKTYLYVINDTSIPTRLDLRLSCSMQTSVERLGLPLPQKLRRASATQSSLSLSLGAYDLCCYRLNDPQAEVVDTQVVPSDAALAQLQDRIRTLNTKMETVDRAAKFGASPLSNPGFESAAAEPEDLPGWRLPVQDASLWSLDDKNPRSGKSALRLTSTNGPVALVSPELPLEGTTRFVTVTLWMRSSQPEGSVRLALEADTEEGLHRQQAKVTVGQEWRRYIFRVANLPTGSLKNPRFRVEPIESGKLWIDDVEISMHRLTPDDVRQLTKTLSTVTLAWEEQRYADCQRLLDGYWGRFLLEDSQKPMEGSPSAVTGQARHRFRR